MLTFPPLPDTKGNASDNHHASKLYLPRTMTMQFDQSNDNIRVTQEASATPSKNDNNSEEKKIKCMCHWDAILIKLEKENDVWHQNSVDLS